MAAEGVGGAVVSTEDRVTELELRVLRLEQLIDQMTTEAAPSQHKAPPQDLKERIRALLRHHGGLSSNVLRERLGCNRSSLYAATSELIAAGEIENLGTPQRPQLHLVDRAHQPPEVTP